MVQTEQIFEENGWDEITVEDIELLMEKVNKFYEERGWPRINAFWLANLFLKRLKNDLDYFVNAEGQKGYGKSNLILLLSLIQARYSGLWQNKYTGIIKKVLPRSIPLPTEWKHIKFGFKFNTNMSFLDDTQDVKRKFNLIDRYMPFAIDEGSKNLHKHNWQSKMQFMLVKLSDSVGKDTEINFYDGVNFKRMTIEDMYKKYGDNPKNIFTWCIDKNKKCYLKKLKSIIKKPLRKRMFKIKGMYNKEIIVTEDHGIYIYKDGELRVESPLNLTLKDKIILPIKLPSKEIIKEDNDMMQLYGAWIADGSYSWDKMSDKRKENARTEISGKEHLPLIKRIQKKYNVNYNLAKNKVDISINSKSFTKEFIKKGFIGNSYTKRIPKWIYNTVYENKIAFLKGLFTGDGNIGTTGEPSYGSVNESLIKDIQILLNMIGIPSTLEKSKKPNIYKNHQTWNYTLTISNLFYSACLKLFEETKLHYSILKNYKRDKNKYNKVKFIDKDCSCIQIKEIKEITEEYKGNVYDLEISSIHNFIGNGVLVHNTERYQNKVVFVCFPHFSELNSVFRNDRIMMRLYLYEKNTHEHYTSCIISLKDVNRYIADPWHTEENAKDFEEILKHKPAALRTPEDILYAEKKLKGYAGSFQVPEIKTLSPKIWNIYMKYKTFHAKKDADAEDDILDDNDKIRKWKVSIKKLCDFIKTLRPNITQAELGRIAGVSYSSILQVGAMKVDL